MFVLNIAHENSSYWDELLYDTIHWLNATSGVNVKKRGGDN